MSADLTPADLAALAFPGDPRIPSNGSHYMDAAALAVAGRHLLGGDCG